ncbi:glycosyltransferase [Algoriphagus machipongonensis]|uniref:Glycosyl transferase n=1 Tax=Algoriphagus machipongonensis TaxID=388413 RepID=A3HRI7_9BACT|nr:glycosyltransferase [Algoriphagus machipongonensis]EAZ82455.1 glycosyl transferase [Algoriphagus machipongonensis]
MKFGGFIITYNRPEILLITLEKIFQQTISPELIWVIDNSEGLETDHIIASHLNSKIKYYRMGNNAGPAGAAAKGLELCEASGMDWIYWGDDNDPPFFENTFERLLAFKDVNPFCGILGSVGHFFDRKKGVIKRIQSKLLEKKEYVEVDVVAGGMSMLVNSNVVRDGIFPNKDLFFGFEELDFCLKASRRGFSIIVPCSIFIDLRKLHNRTDFERPKYKKKASLIREYYSLRNLFMISDELTLRSMRNQLMKKWSIKMLYGFRYGPAYGLENLKMISLAFYHYWKGIKGKTFNLD